MLCSSWKLHDKRETRPLSHLEKFNKYPHVYIYDKLAGATTRINKPDSPKMKKRKERKKYGYLQWIAFFSICFSVIAEM